MIQYTEQQAATWREDVATRMARRALTVEGSEGRAFSAVAPGGFGQGDTTIVRAAPRAVAAVRRLPRGVFAFRGYDNNDNSTVAAQTVYIHANAADCKRGA